MKIDFTSSDRGLMIFLPGLGLAVLGMVLGYFEITILARILTYVGVLLGVAGIALFIHDNANTSE